MEKALKILQTIVCLWIVSSTITALPQEILAQTNDNRITVSNNRFYVGGNQIWINGANTPWDNWNDFGGSFDYTWWDNHFQELHNNGINATRVWITCDGEVGINIDSNGYVSGATQTHWNNLDSLFSIAKNKQVYIMATLISFDHFKTNHPNYQFWRNWLNNDSNIDSYINNYLIPLLNRYKNNPWLWSIDLINEPDWVYSAEGGYTSWDRLQMYFAKASKAVHENSSILVTVGMAMPKYISGSCSGCLGNKVSDTVLQGKINDPDVQLDFWQIHYYPWQDPYWGIPFYTIPVSYGLEPSKPTIIGECPASGSTGHNTIQDYEQAYQKGWQGVMAWTSNGVDSYGSLTELGPATRAFRDNHYSLVFPLDPTPPQPPKNLPISGGGEHHITLTWDPNTELDLAGYRVYYRTDGGSYGVPIDVGNQNHYTLTGLNEGVIYYIYVTAYDTANNESGPSNEVSGSITEIVSLPDVLGGQTAGIVETPYSYTTGGSTSNLGDPVQYFFDWGDQKNSGWLSTGTTQASHSWSSTGTYNVKVQARCATHPSILSNWSTPLAVTITTSGPISNPTPLDGATGVSTNPTLSWSAPADADSYDVYFGTSSPPPYVGNTTSTTYYRFGLSNSTLYYWQIVAKNNSGKLTSGSIWSFTTGSAVCTKPGTPSNPTPAIGATGVSTNPTLSWSACSDTDSYDVYFGTSSNPPLVGNTTNTSYVPSGLSSGSTYYWKVVAKNNCGNSTSGPIWGFTTGTISTINITVTSPNGGKNWKAGTTQTISWTYTGNPGKYVKIELLKGEAVNRTIAYRTSIGSGGSGNYSWRMFRFQTTGSDYKIRVTSFSNSSYTDTSDNNFIISK